MLPREEKNLRFFNVEDFGVLLKNVANMHEEKDLISESRALHESFPTAAEPHVYTR